jgi:hypothetical protein
MAETYLGQIIDIDDVVVYLKNLRTGSSTIRKCKCIGVVRKIKCQNVDIECLKTEATYFNEVSEFHKVVDSEVICILGKTAMLNGRIEDEKPL